MRYFHLRGRNAAKIAVIRTPPDADMIAFWNDLESRDSADRWQPPVATAGEGTLMDWSPSDLLPRLGSEKLKAVLEGFADRAVWLPVPVATAAGEVRYHLLHFRDFADVVDPDRSTFAGGRLLRPHLAKAKVAGRRVFAVRPLAPAVVVDADVKRAVEAARCTGIAFESCPCS